MADWGKYLKNAVANVEQQLDKVLLENQSQTQSSRSASPAATLQRRSGRPDLQERLKRAAGAKANKEDSRDSTPQSGTPAIDAETSMVDGRQQEESGKNSAAQTRATNDRAPQDGAAEGNALKSGASKEDAVEDETHNSARGAPQNDNITLPPILTTHKLMMAPEFGILLHQARKAALAHQGDDMLELVDALEAFNAQFVEYGDSMVERIKSMSSKIAFLSADRAATTTGNEQRVALLLEEGQRLSQQELKLSMIIKKLRAERAAAVSKESVVQAKDKELAVLRAEKTAILNQLKEQEALAEHFRGMAESASASADGISDNNVPAGSNAGNAQSHNELRRRLEAAESNHEVAKGTWHDLESSLLTRIAELELNAETRASSAAQLQESLKDAQGSARDARDQIIALQEELDASEERWRTAEKQHHEELEQLKELLRQKDAELSAPVLQNTIEPPKVSVAEQGQPQPSFETDTALAPEVIINETDSKLPRSTPETVEDLKDNDTEHFGQPPDFLHGPIGPTGPFGSLAEDFDSERMPSFSREDSREMFDDGLSFMAPSASRRESSIVGSEAVSGTQLHIVKKLTLTVRRLENELSTVRKACELAEHQREEAQSEVVRLVDAQDNLSTLQQKYAELEAANVDLAACTKRLEADGVDKSERIDELEADVRDLKDMYREQVEALISEIEDLKK